MSSVDSGSVHSTTSRSPAASRVSALRVFKAGSGQRSPRRSSVVSDIAANDDSGRAPSRAFGHSPSLYRASGAPHAAPVRYKDGMKVIGIAGWSGAGKTTLLTRVIPCLTARGLRVSTVKHAHHGFDVDHPGKDSHTRRMPGASL